MSLMVRELVNGAAVATRRALLEAQTRSHDTRAAITAPHIRLQVLVPELASPAQQAADATYALRKAIDRPELDARRHAAKDASIAFIAAAATLLSPDHR